MKVLLELTDLSQTGTMHQPTTRVQWIDMGDRQELLHGLNDETTTVHHGQSLPLATSMLQMT